MISAVERNSQPSSPHAFGDAGAIQAKAGQNVVGPALRDVLAGNTQPARRRRHQSS